MALLDVTLRVLREQGVTHLVTVANHETQGLRQSFEEDPDRSVTSACREGEAVAIACGLIAGGKSTVLSMENLGLFECLDTLRGLPCAMDIPLPIFIGYLGRAATPSELSKLLGNYSEHVYLAGQWTEPILTAAGIAYRVLPSSVSEAEARAALAEALTAQGPFAILVDHLNEE